MFDPRTRRCISMRGAWPLFLMALWIVVGRAHTIDEPLEPDLVTYVTIGHEMLEGKRLYSDVWDVKPPGLYATYALGEALAGHDDAAFLLGVFCALGTLIAVYYAGRMLHPFAGAFAALFWTISNDSLSLQANQPNTEAFINATCAGAFALLCSHPGGRLRTTRLLVIGGLFALGSTFKPLPIFAALLLVLAHVATPPPGLSRKAALMEAGLVGLVGVLVWALILGYGIVTGQGDIYIATQISMNAHRSSGLLFNLYRYIREGRLVPARLLFLVPTFLLIAIFAVRGIWRRQRHWVLYTAYVFGIHAMIFTPGGAFHPHSYQLWLPAAAIGVAWAGASAVDWPTFNLGSWAVPSGWAIALGVTLQVAACTLPDHLLAPEEWATRKHGRQVVDDRLFARAVASLLRPDETIFEYGNGAALYYYTGRRPGTVTLWAGFLLFDTRLGRKLSRQTLQELQRNPPDLFAVQPPVEWAGISGHQSPPGLAYRLLARPTARPAIAWDKHPIYRWAMRHYRPWPPKLTPRPARMALFARDGSPLARRLGLD